MNAWMRPRLTDYWDQRVGAIEASADELSKLSNRKRQHALDGIKEAVVQHVEALPSEVLLPASVAIVDDLYAAGCSANRWDEPLAQYLEAPCNNQEVRTWAVTGSNRRPLRCKRSALPLS
jgi:hypothetical protein